ncbi:MAG: hypothetical protein JXQ29_10415 [Planctomycetes bacterium]|nr:hypothetical protein [Planctomycetota bacterium]
MSSSESGSASAGGKKTLKGYQWKPWKVVCVAVAALFLVAGVALALTSSGGGGGQDGAQVGPIGGAVGASGPVKGLGSGTSTTLPGGIQIGFEDDPSSSDAWSPALLRGGISFFLAFCLAFALRAFLRLGAIFIGLWALSLFVLSYVGWVDVHWDVIDEHFMGWTHSVGEQFQSFQKFITGSLPSATLAGLGLLAGFKRK